MLARCGSVCPDLGGTWEVKGHREFKVISLGSFQANQDSVQLNNNSEQGWGFVGQENENANYRREILTKPFFPGFSQQS